MQWFQQDIVSFFEELAQNNRRDWFQANKKRYESSVKEPMEAFAAEIIERMQKHDPKIQMLPKDAMFRIYRDTRFSKDKTPYKTNAGIAISRGGKTGRAHPGLYFHVDSNSVGVASGCYFLEPDALLAIRHHIAANLDTFARLTGDANFSKLFGEVMGERNKVLPRELREAAGKQPLLFNKQFYYWAEYGVETLFRKDLPDFVMHHVEIATPLNSFFVEAMSH